MDIFWNEFERSGRIDLYLKYKENQNSVNKKKDRYWQKNINTDYDKFEIIG